MENYDTVVKEAKISKATLIGVQFDSLQINAGRTYLSLIACTISYEEIVPIVIHSFSILWRNSIRYVIYIQQTRISLHTRHYYISVNYLHRVDYVWKSTHREVKMVPSIYYTKATYRVSSKMNEKSILETSIYGTVS